MTARLDRKWYREVRDEPKFLLFAREVRKD
jgi:hypothetical protein